MKVHSAQLASGHNNGDRLFITDHAVIVLDGATAFEPVDVDPGTYAETLGGVIAEQLDADPETAIASTVETAIRHAVARLDLTPGRSPSSTVSVLRVRGDTADLYVLGDSPIYWGNTNERHRVTDERLANLAIPERTTYVSNLRAGHGYDNNHRAVLVKLQRAQRGFRNSERGYWIAETDPRAAANGLTHTLQSDTEMWAVLATDGASDLIDHLKDPPWQSVSRFDDDQLASLLLRLHRWESTADPNGAILPRAKPHDDKTIAAIRSI